MHINLFGLTCVCLVLEDPLREHKYCETTEKTVQNPAPSPMNFLSPILNVSGEKLQQRIVCLLNVFLWYLVAFCVCRLSYAGEATVSRQHSDKSDHLEPRWVLHSSGSCSFGEWTDLRALLCPAALFPFSSLGFSTLWHGWSNESSAQSPGKGRAIMGGTRWGVHQAVLPGQGVLERSHGPTLWPAKQTGAGKDFQTPGYTHVSQWYPLFKICFIDRGCVVATVYHIWSVQLCRSMCKGGGPHPPTRLSSVLEKSIQIQMYLKPGSSSWHRLVERS